VLNNNVEHNQIQSVMALFCVDETVSGIEKITIGRINTTYKVHTSERIYILQMINTHVFKLPESVMENMHRICNYALANSDNIEFVRLLYTRDGSCFVRAYNHIWRCTLFIPNSRNAKIGTTNFMGAGQIIGLFHRIFWCFPCKSLNYTIKDFHAPRARFDCFVKALEQNPKGNNKISFLTGELLDRETAMHDMLGEVKKLNLPVRVTHNDTAFSNILFDALSNEPLCLIDLDTVMPGYIMYDFGDALRDSFSYMTGNENESVKHFINGFMSQLCQLLSKEEKESLYYGAWLITFELALRFLTDYLEGDLYFQISYPTQNLDSAMIQFDTLLKIESLRDFIRDSICEYPPE